MHASKLRTRGMSLAIPGVLAIVAAVATPPVHGDDNNGILGRLFRLGGSSSSASRSKPQRQPQPPSNSELPYGRGAVESTGSKGNGGAFIPPATPRPPATPPEVGSIGDGPSTPELSDSGAGLPPVTPRSRVSTAATTADPLLSRIALGRSNDGGQFGMFLQVFADGTVIDSEGVHRVSPSELRPIAELVGSGELGRLRGHCGAPSSDFIEEVHVVVYEHRLGRLTAVPFSYSGNPQGCDPSVRQLHTLIENLQVKLSGQSPTVATSSSSATSSPAAVSSAPAASNPPPASTGAVIPLTPLASPSPH